MRARSPDLVVLAVLFAVTAIAARAHFALPTDVENVAMKSVGTDGAADARARAREFGRDPTIVVLLEPRSPENLSALDDREIAAWIDAFAARPDVRAIERGPAPAPGVHALAVTVRAGEDGLWADAVRAVQAAARADLPPTYRSSVAGQPVAEVRIADELEREQARILPLLFAVLGAVLLVLYRSPILVAGALAMPLAAVFLVSGLQALLGLSVDPVSSLLGPTLLTVGVAGSVHVVERYRLRLLSGQGVEHATRVAARELRFPFLLTVVTTVAGFLGLAASPIPAVRRFGALASVGVALGYGVTLFALPAWLRVLDRGRAVARWHTTERIACALASFTQRAWLPLVGGTAIVSLGLVALWTTLEVDTDPLRILPASDRLRRQTEHVADVLGGSDVFEVLLPPSPSAASPIATARLVGAVSALPGVAGPAGTPRRSQSGWLLAPFLLEPGGSAAREQTFDAAERVARASGWPDASATGLAVRIARDSGELVRGQLRGLGATLLCLLAVMAFGFRSLRLGLLGLVPNVVPCLLVYGGMAAIGQPLSVPAAMIGTVMLGLIVDDTIHLLHAHREAGGGGRRAVARALARAGRPVVVTTLVLSAGFAATAFGRLETTREFGRLATGALVAALFADVVLLPALLLAGSRARAPRPSSSPAAAACLPRSTTTS